MDADLKNHWEKIYETKNPSQFSWFQKVPTTSLNFIKSFDLPKTAKIIDIGGGDGELVDHLLDEGYQNISVLDISTKAIDKAKKRLGDRAAKVTWIVSNITDFRPHTLYDVWHDRATFHFLLTNDQIAKYLNTARNSVLGFLVVGTFSNKGPEKCSGLQTKQYGSETLTTEFQNGFEKIRCIVEDHITPTKSMQNFMFCSFKRAFPPGHSLVKQ